MEMRSIFTVAVILIVVTGTNSQGFSFLTEFGFRPSAPQALNRKIYHKNNIKVFWDYTGVFYVDIWKQ